MLLIDVLYYIYAFDREIPCTIHEPTQLQFGLRPRPSSQPTRLPHSIFTKIWPVFGKYFSIYIVNNNPHYVFHY